MFSGAWGSGEKKTSPLDILKLPGKLVGAVIDVVETPLLAATDLITPAGVPNILGEVLSAPGELVHKVVDVIDTPIDAISDAFVPDKDGNINPVGILKLPGKVVDSVLDAVETPLVGLTDVLTPENVPNVIGEVLKLPGKIVHPVLDTVETPINALEGKVGPEKDKPTELVPQHKNGEILIFLVNVFYWLLNKTRVVARFFYNICITKLSFMGMLVGYNKLGEDVKESTIGQFVWKSIQETPLIANYEEPADPKSTRRRPKLGGAKMNPITGGLELLNSGTLLLGKSTNFLLDKVGFLEKIPILGNIFGGAHFLVKAQVFFQTIADYGFKFMGFIRTALSTLTHWITTAVMFVLGMIQKVFLGIKTIILYPFKSLT